MALVTLSGYPCSGKTTRALALQALLESESLPVTLINEELLNLAVEAYDGQLGFARCRLAIMMEGQRRARKSPRAAACCRPPFAACRKIESPFATP
jgi:hypothetical protein